MPIPSELKRVETALATGNKRELEWSLWYARMRQRVPSARPADVKYWSAVEAQVDAVFSPPPEPTFPTPRRKKKGVRGLGLGPIANPGPTNPE